MSCKTCKKSSTELYQETIDKTLNKVSKTKNIAQNIGQFFLKTLVFIFLCVVILPICIPVTLYMLFATAYLDKGVNLVPVLVYLGKKLLKDKEEDDDEDEEDEFENEEDYDNVVESDWELENADDIIEFKK